MSGKQSVAKKEWLRQRFDDGLVFYRSEERGKCFIEYIPAENAWVPIAADGYLYINCLWVSGSMKGHGYSNDLLEACIRDAKAQGKKGICILCAGMALGIDEMGELRPVAGHFEELPTDSPGRRAPTYVLSEGRTVKSATEGRSESAC